MILNQETEKTKQNADKFARFPLLKGTIPRSQIQVLLDKPLGRGAFGQVYLGVYQRSTSGFETSCCRSSGSIDWIE